MADNKPTQWTPFNLASKYAEEFGLIKGDSLYKYKCNANVTQPKRTHA